jgi:apolipoprotein N-acyltransferase
VRPLRHADDGAARAAGSSSAKRSRWALERPTLFACALGAATVAGFAPLYLFPLPILTLAVLLYLWTSAPDAKKAAKLGWWFGLGFFLTGVSWVYVSLHDFGAMPAPLAALATLLFCAYLALYPAVVGYLYRRVPGSLVVKALALAPAAWTLAEWTRGWLFTGFPWIGIGYSQVPSSPLGGFAPVVGIYGVTLATVASAGAIFLIVRRMLERRHPRSPEPESTPSPAAQRKSASSPSSLGRRVGIREAVGHRSGTSHRVGSMTAWGGGVVVPALFFLVLWACGFALAQVRWTHPTGEPLPVALLQGNIPQEIKWTEEGLRTTLITYRDLAIASDARLIVLPETALPLFLHDVPRDYLNGFAAHARRNGGDVLIGIPEREQTGDYYNSVVTFGTAPTQAYRKSHLVPFGEFIPLRPVLAWIVSVLSIPLQDFTRGTLEPRPLEVAGERIAVNICYEDAFGEEIIRQLPQATLLVNVSNVAWFGRSIAPRQHLQISQARALETGRYMLRATNTGMTAVIDEGGRVVEAAPQFSTAALSATVQGRGGATPYVRWGNSVALALCAVLLAGTVWRARARQSRTS